MFTITLILVMTSAGREPMVYRDPDIGTLGACLAVTSAYLKHAIEVARSDVHYEAGCVVETPGAKDASDGQ
jgi:hypothetical protein